MDLARSQIFPSACKDGQISAFWDQQIRRLGELALDSSETEAHWEAQISPAIRPAAGKVKVVAILSPMDQANMGGRRWVKQFIFGIPLVVELSQRDGYPPSRKEVIPPVKAA